MNTTPLHIAILWHMHQPYYRDPVNGEYLLPWTYLHGIKDYYDMAAIVGATPGVKVNFNLVPSLLEQLSDYAAGTALDPWLMRGMMAPAEMAEKDRLFVIENFFAANRQRMIEPYSRYLELLFMAGNGNSVKNSDRIRNFRNQDILDLQVWFYLAWTGEAARRQYPELNGLIRKGRNFSEEDKSLLFAIQREILGGIVPIYNCLRKEGKAELSLSPYFHPIMPLLCDMQCAKTAIPRINLPSARFRHPEDARAQVMGGIACFEGLFGFTPAGIWPSEGAISDDALSIIADCGIRWAASDEGILSRSIPGGLETGRGALYHPYSFITGEKEIILFFRDQTLSDLIGFTYSKWEPEMAIKDFIGRLEDIRTNFPEGRVVTIILDGENAWEYYQNNGYDFVSLLYKGIMETPGLELATFSELLTGVPARQALRHVHPGSWINADYGVWVGHPEENLAWDLIGRTRDTAIRQNPRVGPLLSGDASRGDGDDVAWEICRSIMAAEGSDWFWWYGDDHFSPHSDRFDLLFRRHLLHVYGKLNLDPPRELLEPIKRETPAGFVREPADLITPTISGIVTDYFEWLAAGLYDLTRQSSAMHAAEILLQSFFYGYDREALYFRIDGTIALNKTLLPGDQLILHLQTNGEYRAVMEPGTEQGILLVKNENSWKPTAHPCSWRIGRICEVRVPLVAVSLEPGCRLLACITLVRSANEIGRWPPDGAMSLKYQGVELESETWPV
jgi:alpha-amylase/alpha-mannosidase (GH57 family)